MLLDARELDDQATLRADVCIAGAGAAGITLARDLRGAGLDVVLLEGGGRDLGEADASLYEGENVGLDYRGLTGCRVRAFGGSTSLWAGMCAQLEPDDFRRRDWMPDSGWPITLDDLLPWYRRAHVTCEIGGAEYDAEALGVRLGLPPLPLDPARVRTVVYHNSPPTRFGERYRGDLEQAGDVRVYLNASLVEVEVTENGAGVRRFGCRTRGPDRRFTVEAKHYVLAMGGVENARILLASNRQIPAGVGNAHDLVGRYFMEHPHYGEAAYCVLHGADLSFYRFNSVHTFDGDTPAGRRSTVFGALSLPAEVRGAEALPTFACTFRATEPEELKAIGRLHPERIRALLAAAAEDAAVYRVFLRAEQSPIPESRLTLSDERDALGLPRVVLDWRIAERDLLAYGRGLARLGAELGRAGLGRLWVPLDDDGRFAPPSTRGGCHHLGTTRMSADPRTGVVDADCRVHGLDNLFIAGSSVYPTGGYVNPTLTLVALAHRLAAHLKERTA